MSLTYGFYNSVNGDRTYDAEDFSRFFDGVITDGVLAGVGTAFETTANGTSIVVGTGRAWFNKTWTYIDANVSLELPTTSNINNRIDLLVLEIDPRTSTRANRLVFVEGEPSVSPSNPTLAPPSGVYHYPLYRIYRRRDINEIRSQDLTKLVGTAQCPIATNMLTDVQAYDNLATKRSIVRGNYLGNSFTTAQKAAIRDGSFDGLYLGDYWTHNNTNWRIVDFNYFLNLAAGPNGADSTSSNSVNISENHIVIVPDDTLALYPTELPFIGGAKTASNCGYDFSTRSKTRIDNIASKLGALVGTTNLLAPRAFYTTTYSGASTGMNHVRRFSRAIPMTEHMLMGSQKLGLRAMNAYSEQLALYKHALRYFWIGYDRGQVGSYDNAKTNVWLMDQFNIDNWVTYRMWIGADRQNPRSFADAQHRPVMAVTGK